MLRAQFPRLIVRCGKARLIGTATAPDHSLEFSKKSADGSGKATLIRSMTGLQTPGVLFEIEARERDALDRAEGAGAGYDRIDELNICTTVGTIAVTTYLATVKDSDLIPFDWYQALVIAGALEHALPSNHVDHLRAIDHRPDPDTGRKSRGEALEALTGHG
ncbi:MAG: gamma-glutamylcyclotransferase family protein [Rubrimonas sp.]